MAQVHADQVHDGNKPRIVEPAAEGDACGVKLTWKSWLVVLVACFGIAGQTFAKVAAGSVVTFISRDLDDESASRWIVEGPLLVQSALAPIVGRLSDAIDRKYVATLPALVGLVGAVMSAKAHSISLLVVGSFMIGIALASASVLYSIPSEVLPRKFRPLANGFSFVGAAAGGLISTLGAGAVTNAGTSGWRYIFWIQAAFHGATAVGLFFLYNPPKRHDRVHTHIRQLLWACDPIGSALFFSSTTLLLLGLNWAGSAYAWGNPHVAVPISLGTVLLLGFTLYEWKGRPDGLAAHAFFRKNINFACSIFAFGTEGWIYYGAINPVVPKIILTLGWETNSWDIGLRMLSFKLVNLGASVLITWYATRMKDLKSPLLLSFTIFLAVTILYTVLRPSWDKVHYAINVLTGLGQAGPLTLLLSYVQFAAPRGSLSTATGFAQSVRAISGALGSAVMGSIINSRLRAHYRTAVAASATRAGLPSSSVPALLSALDSTKDSTITSVPGVDNVIFNAVTTERRRQHAYAYRLAWASVIPFVVLSIVAVACLRSVADLMTEEIDATVEHEKVKQVGGGADGTSAAQCPPAVQGLSARGAAIFRSAKLASR